MLTGNRKYQYKCLLSIKRSKLIQLDNKPKDDLTNWLFISMGDKYFSFVYEIENPLEANYETPFMIFVSFTMLDYLKNHISLNYNYKVFRGQEFIGNIKIVLNLE